MTWNNCEVAVVVAARHVIARKRSPVHGKPSRALDDPFPASFVREPPPNLAEGTPLSYLSTLCVASLKVAPS